MFELVATNRRTRSKAEVVQVKVPIASVAVGQSVIRPSKFQHQASSYYGDGLMMRWLVVCQLQIVGLTDGRLTPFGWKTGDATADGADGSTINELR